MAGSYYLYPRRHTIPTVNWWVLWQAGQAGAPTPNLVLTPEHGASHADG